MLGGRISTQDEEEVEDELAAMEAEAAGPQQLPTVPDDKLPAGREQGQADRLPERQALPA